MDTKFFIDMFEILNEGILICDRDVKILYFNDSYANLIKDNLKIIKGVPLVSLRKGTRVPEVIMTKKPIVGLLRGENDQEYFCNIYPIFENNSVTPDIVPIPESHSDVLFYIYYVFI